MEISVEKAAGLLLDMDNVGILTHQNPDGDTLGSGFGLCYALQSLGKKAKVLCSDEIPARYAFLQSQQQSDFEVDSYVAVDVADPALLGSLQPLADQCQLCIDHHVTNKQFANQTLLDSTAAATAQIMVLVCRQMGVHITPQIASCLYTGICTDTGCFKYQNTTSQTLRLAADLIDLQADFVNINRLMFDTKTKQRFLAEGTVISEMEYFADGKIALAVLPMKLIQSLGLTPLDFDGISGLPRQVEGVEIGITIREKQAGVYKISCRSSQYVDVSKMCSEVGGGGHMRAAGCQIEGDVQSVKDTIVNLAKKYL